MRTRVSPHEGASCPRERETKIVRRETCTCTFRPGSQFMLKLPFLVGSKLAEAGLTPADPLFVSHHHVPVVQYKDCDDQEDTR